MQITLRRIAVSDEVTIGILYIEGKYECWTLEEHVKTKKVNAKFRIPAESYILQPYETGPMYAQYKHRWPAWHQGMIQLKDVPDFKFLVLFHAGNKDDAGVGGIIVGRQVSLTGKAAILESRLAYGEFYTKIADSLYAGDCKLTVIDDDQGIREKSPAKQLREIQATLPPVADRLDLRTLRQEVLALGKQKKASDSPVLCMAVAELLQRLYVIERIVNTTLENQIILIESQ